MVDFGLLNLLLYNIQQSNLASIVIFHCWDLESFRVFSEQAANNYIYTRYINLHNIGADFWDFENQFLKHKRPDLGVFVDLNCRHADLVLNTASELKLYNYHYRWLIYEQAANITKFERLFVDASLSVDADVTYVLRRSNNSFIFYDVYNNGRVLGGKLNMTVDREIICDELGCQLAQYLSELHLRSKYGHRNRLHDITWRVSTVVINFPLSLPESQILDYLLSENNTYIDPISRSGFKMLLIMQDLLGVNMTLTFKDRWSTNETHGGTVGDIITQSADFTSSPFLCTASRLKYVSVLAETGGFRSLCLFRTPHRADISGKAFLKPFNGTVWITFAIILIILSIFLWLTFIVETRAMRLYISNMPSLLATSLISFGSACVQSSNFVPLSVGGRMAYYVLLMISFIIYNYYTSIVVSSLLSSPVKSNIKTLGQIADSSLEIGLEPLPYTFVYLNASQLPEVRRFVRRKIESKKDQHKLWISVEEGIKRVRDEPGFVFVLETSTSYYLVEQSFQPYEICDLNEVMLRADKSLFTQVHKNSTYKEIIRLKAMRMLESGVYNKHHRQWVKEKLHCNINSNYVLVVGLDYTAPLFVLLAIAYVVVIILLFIEIACNRCAFRKSSTLIASLILPGKAN